MEPTVEQSTPTEQTQPEQVPEQVSHEQDVNNEAAPQPTEELPTAQEAPPVVAQPVVEEPEEDFALPQAQPDVKPLTMEDIKVDPATGEVDLSAFLGTFNERMNEAKQAAVQESNTMAELRDRYRSEWDKAEGKYPQLKKDKALREWVYARHADTTQRTGKWMSPTKAADEFFALTKAAESKGIEAAQSNVEIQRSAQLESSNRTVTPSISADLQARLNSSNPAEARQARIDTLKQRIKEGKL